MNAVDASKLLQEQTVRYSICTLVTNFSEYHTMLETFRKKGFKQPECEFLYLDNSRGNQYDGYRGLNVFLRAARGKHVIICHQDVELLCDGIEEMDARLEQLEERDPCWGVAGNAGGRYGGRLHDLAVRITDPHGDNISRGPFPCRVSSLDENFLIVKASANLALSGNLRGFHLYATDLAIVADMLGYSAYVIDFNVHHKSPGKIRRGHQLLDGEIEFDAIRSNLARKYARAFSPRWYSSTTTEVFITPNLTRNIGYNLARIFEQLGHRTRKHFESNKQVVKRLLVERTG